VFYQLNITTTLAENVQKRRDSLVFSFSQLAFSLCKPVPKPEQACWSSTVNAVVTLPMKFTSPRRKLGAKVCVKLIEMKLVETEVEFVAERKFVADDLFDVTVDV